MSSFILSSKKYTHNKYKYIYTLLYKKFFSSLPSLFFLRTLFLFLSLFLVHFPYSLIISGNVSFLVCNRINIYRKDRIL